MAVRGEQNLRIWIDGVRTLDPASANVSFTSANTSVATVSNDGTITAVAEGSTTVTVTLGDQSVIINVSVT